MYKIALFIVLLATPAAAYAAPAEGDVRALLWNIEKAKAGTTLIIPEGVYDIADIRIRRDLTLTGEGEVVFFSSSPVAKGLLNPVDGASLRVENITFRDAASPDLNGAGIRHDGDDLTIVDCRFIGNEDGVLATGSEDGVIRINDTEFIDSGHGDGYSHGIYVLHAALLDIQDSKFTGTKIGHHVKSLAAATRISGTAFDDASGQTSYAVDASRGGDVLIENNTFIKAADADNNALFNYDLTRGGEAVSVVIKNNVVTNRHRHGEFLRNATDLTPIIEDNTIVNENGGRMSGGKIEPGLLERAKNAIGVSRDH